MRLLLRATIALVLLAALAVGAWAWLDRARLARQWAAYRVGAAESYAQARTELAWFETGPDSETKLRDLVGKWGTGNQQFDLYLAWYVYQPDCTEALREAFSLEFGWREELLPRWAHYWSWHTSAEPSAEIGSIVALLDLLIASGRPKTMTWREVLDLQAAFTLLGQANLARRLTPANWQDRFQSWRARQPGPLPAVARPSKPFPDWRGPEIAHGSPRAISGPRGTVSDRVKVTCTTSRRGGTSLSAAKGVVFRAGHALRSSPTCHPNCSTF